MTKIDDRYGFVYIWYDKKRKMYYIGSHWGREDDGYICSSPRMRKAYKRRPDDFKRRILSKIMTDRNDLLDQEQKWFDMVKLREKYYNLNFLTKRAWWCDPDQKLTVGQKISKKLKGVPLSKERIAARIGRKITEETREKFRNRITTEETKLKLSIAGMGRKFSQETKDKIGEANKKTYSFLDPFGEIVVIDDLSAFCQTNNLKYSPMVNLYNGKYCNDTYKGWRSLK